MGADRYSQVLLASWRQRDRSWPWVRRGIAALVAVLCIASLVWLPADAGWRVLAGLALTVSIGCWLAVSYNLLEQNHPTAARTVPGHVHTLKRAVLLGWAASTLLSTALLGLMLAAPGLWPVLLLSCGFLAVFLLWSARLVWLWVALTLLSPLAGAYSSQLAPVRQAVVALWESHRYEVLLAGLALQAWLVLRAIGDGGVRHQARYAKQALMRRAMRMQMEGTPQAFSAWAPFERLAAPFARILSAWLQHLLERADNNSVRSVMARAEIVLHGQQHWLRYALTVGVIAAAVLILFTVALANTGASLAQLLQHGAFGMGIGIASVGLNPAMTMSNMLWQSRREQALLRLLPGMPQGRALNLAVARLHRRDFIVGWLLTALALMALGTAAGHQLLLGLPLAALPVAAFTLTRRPALLRPPTPMTAVLPSFAFLTLAGVLYVLGHNLGMPLWSQAVAMAGVTAPLLAWRWRRLVDAPAALPAGRLAA